MDLVIPRQVSYSCNFSSDVTCQANTWAQYTQEGTLSCNGCFAAIWSTFDLGTIYLAQNNTNIFMTGTKGDSTEPDEPQYQNLLYVLPGDGSCGSQSCAISTVSLPIMFNQCEQCAGEVRSIQVTSLAAGYVGGTPYLAVGLSDFGVQIYNVSNPSSPQLTGTFGGMATSDAFADAADGAGVGSVGVRPAGDRRHELGQRGLRRSGQCRRQPSGELADVVRSGYWRHGRRSRCRRRSGSARTAPRSWRSG